MRIRGIDFDGPADMRAREKERKRRAILDDRSLNIWQKIDRLNELDRKYALPEARPIGPPAPRRGGQKSYEQQRQDILDKKDLNAWQKRYFLDELDRKFGRDSGYVPPAPKPEVKAPLGLNGADKARAQDLMENPNIPDDRKKAIVADLEKKSADTLKRRRYAGEREDIVDDGSKSPAEKQALLNALDRKNGYAATPYTGQPRYAPPKPAAALPRGLQGGLHIKAQGIAEDESMLPEKKNALINALKAQQDDLDNRKKEDLKEQRYKQLANEIVNDGSKPDYVRAAELQRLMDRTGHSIDPPDPDVTIGLNPDNGRPMLRDKDVSVDLTDGDVSFLTDTDNYKAEFSPEQQVRLFLLLKQYGRVTGQDLIDLGMDFDNPDEIAAMITLDYKGRQVGVDYAGLDAMHLQEKFNEAMQAMFVFALTRKPGEGLFGEKKNDIVVKDNIPVQKEKIGKDLPAARGDSPKQASKYSGELVVVNHPDRAADALAKRIGGQARVKFKNDPDGKEFDVVSNTYIGESKPALKCLNSDVRRQMKRAFEAANDTGRSVYYHFEGQPAREVLEKLYEYSIRYGVKVVIDTEPLLK